MLQCPVRTLAVAIVIYQNHEADRQPPQHIEGPPPFGFRNRTASFNDGQSIQACHLRHSPPDIFSPVPYRNADIVHSWFTSLTLRSAAPASDRAVDRLDAELTARVELRAAHVLGRVTGNPHVIG